LKSLPDILEAIRQKFPDLTQAAQQAELRKALGSEEAYRFVLQMSAGVDQLRGSITTLTEASTSSSNAAEQMAAAMNTDSYALLAQQIQNLWAQIGQFVNTALGPFLDSTKQAILEVQRWIETNPELTQQIVEISMYLAAFLLGVSAVAATVAGVITTFTFFAGALAKVSAGLAVLTAGVKGFGVVTALASAPVVLLVAKILLIVGAVAAVVSAIYYFRHEIMGVFAEVGAFLRDWFVIFYDHAAAAVEKVKGAFVSAFSYVRDFVEGVMNRISNVLQSAWDFVGRLLGRIGQIAFGGEIQAVADLPTSSVNNSVAITVNQQPGESSEALALRVANAIQRRQGR
jgi:phage-related tail protein